MSAQQQQQQRVTVMSAMARKSAKKKTSRLSDETLRLRPAACARPPFSGRAPPRHTQVGSGRRCGTGREDAAVQQYSSVCRMRAASMAGTRQHQQQEQDG